MSCPSTSTLTFTTMILSFKDVDTVRVDFVGGGGDAADVELDDGGGDFGHHAAGDQH